LERREHTKEYSLFREKVSILRWKHDLFIQKTATEANIVFGVIAVVDVVVIVAHKCRSLKSSWET
jgi:hypothetical protein